MAKIQIPDRARQSFTSRDKYPCNGCTERFAGCHGVCLRYFAAKEKADLRKAKEREVKEHEEMATERTVKRGLKKTRQL